MWVTQKTEAEKSRNSLSHRVLLNRNTRRQTAVGETWAEGNRAGYVTDGDRLSRRLDYRENDLMLMTLIGNFLPHP